MASLASAAGLIQPIHSLSLEAGSRRMYQSTSGNVVSMLSSSFAGDISCLLTSPNTLSTNGQLSSSSSSRVLHTTCVRMDSNFQPVHLNEGNFPPFGDDSWKRSAVAMPEYAVTERDVDLSIQRGVPGDMSGQNMYISSGQGMHGNMSVQGSNFEQPRALNNGSDITVLGLKAELVEALRKRGITHLFPIQDAVLKPAADGLDLIGRARTGTGKTLAFGIPIIQNLLEENQNGSSRFSRNPRVLVLAPTRELAVQVEKEFMESAPTLSTLCVYGGVPISGQQRKLQNGVDIAVGTPGRIMDLIERGSLALHEVRYLVLDEADQMLAIGFAEDVEKILENVPANRQSMLFSATMPSWVSQISRKYLKNPLMIDLVGDSKEKLAQGIKLFSLTCPPMAKRSILSDLITVYGKGGKSIVFTQTKKDADEVALSMSRILGAEALHGDISQVQREKTLSRFRSGKFSVLIATDVAARGLDIPDVDLVIHYEAPNDPETFVHRSGRTGRAGKDGTAILIHTSAQIRTVKTIERDVGCRFEPIIAPTVEDVLRASSEQAQDSLRKVHPELMAAFLPTAHKVLQEQGVEAFAAAIAQLSGFTQPPASRSLITHEQGWMTVKFTRIHGVGGLSSPGRVMGALASIFQRAADEVGKIQMLDPSEGMGAVLDLPEDVAKELLALQLAPEDCIQAISKLPRLQYEEAPRDRYGMFSPRGGYRTNSGGGGTGPVRGRSSSWGNTRNGSSSWGDNFNNMSRSGSMNRSGGSWGDNLGNMNRSGSSWGDNLNMNRSGGSWGDNSGGMNRNGTSWADNSVGVNMSGSSWGDKSGGMNRSGSSWGDNSGSMNRSAGMNRSLSSWGDNSVGIQDSGSGMNRSANSWNGNVSGNIYDNFGSDMNRGGSSLSDNNNSDSIQGNSGGGMSRSANSGGASPGGVNRNGSTNWNGQQLISGGIPGSQVPRTSSIFFCFKCGESDHRAAFCPKQR